MSRSQSKYWQYIVPAGQGQIFLFFKPCAQCLHLVSQTLTTPSQGPELADTFGTHTHIHGCDRWLQTLTFSVLLLSIIVWILPSVSRVQFNSQHDQGHRLASNHCSRHAAQNCRYSFTQQRRADWTICGNVFDPFTSQILFFLFFFLCYIPFSLTLIVSAPQLVQCSTVSLQKLHSNTLHCSSRVLQNFVSE